MIHSVRLSVKFSHFLIQLGYPSNHVQQIIKNSRPVNQNRPNWQKASAFDYLTPKMINEIVYKERILFFLFPEYLPEGQTVLPAASHRSLGKTA